MSVIYEPKGKAREYSPLACNLYIGCSHRCKYCYAPGSLRKFQEDYFGNTQPRNNVIQSLERELNKNRYCEQVLLSFIGDVYSENADGNKTTTEALELFLKHKTPVSILTKGGKRCLQDLNLFKKFGTHIQIGATLTFWDDKKSLEWEAGGALPKERLEVLDILHKQKVQTFASFEPVIEPAESLKLMHESLELDCVDIYKIGKLNNYNGLDKGIDWTSFLTKALDMLREAGKQLYVKHDLRLAAPGVRLYGNEVLPDEHNAM